MHQLITYKSKGTVKNRPLVKFFDEKIGQYGNTYICASLAFTSPALDIVEFRSTIFAENLRIPNVPFLVFI